MENCTELKILHCSTCFSWYGRYLNQKFPSIEHATFSSFGFGYYGLDTFIKLNPSLKCLSFVSCEVQLLEVINSVIQTLPTLVQLEIDEIAICGAELEEIIPNLSRLNCLKVLKLDFKWICVKPLLKGLAGNRVPIERLKIISGVIDTEAIEVISQMKQIKILNLNKCYGLTDEHIIHLAKELLQLKELDLNHRYIGISTNGLKKMLALSNKLSLLKLNSIYINVDDYQMMMRTVQSRTEKVKLLIEISIYWDEVYDPEETASLSTNHNSYLEINYIEPKLSVELGFYTN